MKEFIKMMMKDYESENFTRKEWLIYGVVYPVALIVVIGLAGLIESL